MIEFKIIVTADKSQQATYQHLGTELVLGKVDGDMLIDDPGLSAVQIRIRVEGKQGTIENLDPKVDVRLNGKAIEQITPLKERDNITVARTTINITRLDSTGLTTPEPYEHPQAKLRFTEGTKEKAILDALEYLAQTSAGGSTATPPPAPAVKPPPLPKR